MMTERPAQASARRIAETIGLDPLTHEAHIMLFKAYTSLTAAARRRNPSRLSLGRYNVLRLLYGAEDRRLSMSEIGDGLEVSPTVVTRLVDSLVAEGLVRRVEHASDKRRTWAEMTRAGVDLFEAEMPLMLREVEKLWNGMEPEEKRLLIHLLARLRLNLVSAAGREATRQALATVEAAGSRP